MNRIRAMANNTEGIRHVRRTMANGDGTTIEQSGRPNLVTF